MSTTTMAVSIPPLSQSRQSLMACPFLYRERVIQGKAEASNPYAERGQQIHAAIADYLHHLVTTRQISDYGYFDTLLDRGYGQEALDILEGLKESMIIDPERVLAVEEYIGLDENFEPTLDPVAVAYEGTPDYIQSPESGVAEIWDWKSYFQIVDADTFQAKLYPLLVFQNYPHIQLVRFHLQFVRYGVSRSVEYTRSGDLEKLKKLVKRERNKQAELHQVAFEMANEHEEAMPGSHCAWCSLLDNCPIKEINPYTDQSPQDRVRFAVWLDAARKQNLQVLKDLTNASGPIGYRDDNGMRYETGFVLKEKSSYPALAVMPIITANDPELAPKLTLSGLSAPLKAKKRAVLRELVDAQKLVTQNTRFCISGTEIGDEEY